MKIGQIVYNLIGLDGRKISTKNDLSGISEDSSEKINILENILPKIAMKEGWPSAEIIQLGIQAPEGSQFEINGHEIKIGRTETYQLDNFQILSLMGKDIDTINIIIDYVAENLI